MDNDEIELPEPTAQPDNYVDSKNDILIKHFDRNFARSKSNVDYPSNKIEIIHGASVSNTNSDNSGGSPVFDRGIADGGSNQHDSDFGNKINKKKNKKITIILAGRTLHIFIHFLFNSFADEFSSQDEDDEVSSKASVQAATKTAPSHTNGTAVPTILGRCKALYSYSPKLYDELELNPG